MSNNRLSLSSFSNTALNSFIRGRVEFYKEHYPPGTRICLDSNVRIIRYDPNPVPSGTKVTVSFADDCGMVFCKFDCGRSLTFRRLILKKTRYLLILISDLSDDTNWSVLLGFFLDRGAGKR